MEGAMPDLNETMSGVELRQTRIAHGDTQKQCAEKLYCDVERIKDYEQGVHGLSPQQTHLIRLTYDPLYRAQWLQSLHKRDT
jgi:transcriptional regulator with XRE-family HTH domain